MSALRHPCPSKCLSKRSWLRASAWAGPLLLAAALTSDSARADAYTWTDANGVVHFSETPPPEAKSKKLKPSDASGSSAAPAVSEVRRTEKIWRSDTPSRSVMLEKIVPLLLDADKGFSVGSRCDGSEYSVAEAMGWSQSSKLKDYFSVSLMAYGFATPGEAAARAFANEAPKPAELNVIAEVIDVSASCAGVDHLRINWRFWDNLRRRQVLAIVTEGADSSEPQWSTRSKTGLTRHTDISRSFSGAFIQALETLLRKPEFLKLVTPSDPLEAAAAVESEAGADLEPVVLSFRHGLGTGSFRSQVAALKEAAPTIRTSSGHGSGVLLAPGYVLTNNHVVGSEPTVMVIFGEREIVARVLRRDEKRDVALLKLHEELEARPYLVARRAPIDGDTLYVIGTPLDEGLSQSVTKGVLSGTRELNGQSYYQTDAAVNPGNSGGPVLDDHGELVGLVVSGLRTQTGSSLDVNYVIPIQSALATLAIRPALARKGDR